ncbi:MAG: PASTA domain-containing protein [Candidatus Competibacteraceae bacterium]|nr:PASTA domain-containing protein [Candidatus Competibacteraceae bacterium]
MFSKYFWINLLLAILAFVAVTVLVFKSFGWYTHHNESIEVPDLTGLQLNDARKLLQEKNLRLAVVDSVYEVPKEKKNISHGEVVDQNPKPGEKVKRNRRFYIVIRSFSPPMVDMPDLIDLSLRQAIGILESKGLKLGKAIKKPGMPPVMKQFYKGESIKPGTKIPKGSTVDVWIGQGGSDVKIGVPNLIGKSRSEAMMILSTSNLNLGAEIYTDAVKDSSKAVVIRQSPSATAEPTISEGSDIDLWFSNP